MEAYIHSSGGRLLLFILKYILLRGKSALALIGDTMTIT